MAVHAPNANIQNPREAIVGQVFDSLCRSILRERGNDALTEQRLWRAPDLAARFVFGATTDAHGRRIAPVVHHLRTEVSQIINLRLDRSAIRNMLSQRLASARTEFSFRPWRIADAGRYVALLDHQSVWESLPDEYPGTMTEPMARDLIEISNGWSDRHAVSAVEWHGQPIGQVRLQFDSSTFADAAEISYWLGPEYWNRGLGTRLVSLFTADSFRQRPRLERLFAVVLDGNTASMRLLEKAGYRYEAFRYRNVPKNGQRRSSHVLSVSRADYAMIES